MAFPAANAPLSLRAPLRAGGSRRGLHGCCAPARPLPGWAARPGACRCAQLPGRPEPGLESAASTQNLPRHFSCQLREITEGRIFPSSAASWGNRVTCSLSWESGTGWRRALGPLAALPSDAPGSAPALSDPHQESRGGPAAGPGGLLPVAACGRTEAFEGLQGQCHLLCPGGGLEGHAVCSPVFTGSCQHGDTQLK